jgi:hypothetical protein
MQNSIVVRSVRDKLCSSSACDKLCYALSTTLQVYDLLNALEDRLGVNNSAVVLATIKVCICRSAALVVVAEFLQTPECA